MPHAMAGVSLSNRLRVRALWSHFLQISPSMRLTLDRRTIPQQVMQQPTCATAVPSGILS